MILPGSRVSADLWTTRLSPRSSGVAAGTSEGASATAAVCRARSISTRRRAAGSAQSEDGSGRGDRHSSRPECRSQVSQQGCRSRHWHESIARLSWPFSARLSIGTPSTGSVVMEAAIPGIAPLRQRGQLSPSSRAPCGTRIFIQSLGVRCADTMRLRTRRRVPPMPSPRAPHGRPVGLGCP